MMHPPPAPSILTALPDPLWLDGAALQRLLAARFEDPARALDRIDIERLAARFGRRYCRRLAARLGEDDLTAEMLFKGLYLTLYRLLLVYDPFRRLLREGLRTVHTVILPLKADYFVHHLEKIDGFLPFLFAYQLERHGVAVRFSGEAGPESPVPERVRFRVETVESKCNVARLADGILLVETAARNLRKLLATDPRQAKAYRRYHRWRKLRREIGRLLRGRRRESLYWEIDPAAALASPQPLLQEWVDGFLLPACRNRRHFFHRRLRGVQRLLICDHLFLDTGIAAELARERGIPVTLLPHSTNPWCLDAWRLGDFAESIAVTGSGAARIRAALPGAKVRLMPEIMLPGAKPAAPLVEEGQPLAVILIGNWIGPYHYRVSPAVQREAIRQVLTLPPALRGRVTVTVKLKINEYAADYAPYLNGEDVRLSTAPLAALTQPNQVHLCLNTPSSAMLEAVQAGKPVVFVKDRDYREHIPVESAPFPRVRAEDFWACIEELCAPEAYRAMVSKQQEWLARERQGAEPVEAIFRR